MNEDKLKLQYFKKAEKLIETHDKLNIIYLRVSTKGLGQEEGDQLNDILRTFKLKEEECLIIQAKESAYQIWKQKTRKFQIIIDLINGLDNDCEKNCYFWSIDRIYRNRELLEEFYDIAKKTNTKIYSYIENFINILADMQDRLPDGMGFIIDMQVKQLVNFFGWMAEMESKKRANRLKKSLTLKDDRYFSNKGRLFGKKLKTITGKKIKDPKTIEKIELAIAKRIKNGVSYREIIRIFLEKKDIKLSIGYIAKIKKKHL